jgi:gamma-glutamylcyclotransferase (GGCT)/AIG2-like uncharacterized protein YtfP
MMRDERAREDYDSVRLDMGAPRHLFAYGTLMPQVAPPAVASVLRRLRRIGQGTARGRLYDLGEYPGVILDRPGRMVYGEVFKLPPGKRILNVLDGYEDFVPTRHEGNLFVRERCAVTMRSGESLDCWVYAYKGSLRNARLIPGGRYVPKRRAPPILASARSESDKPRSM